MKIKDTLKRVPTCYWYGLLSVLVIPAYLFGWGILTTQSTIYIAIVNKLSVNIILCFYLVGLYVNIYTKNMAKWKGWVIWALAIMALIMFFKYVGGLETRW
jgi:hypothetical protein